MKLIPLVLLGSLAACITPEQSRFLDAGGAYHRFEGVTSYGESFVGASWFEFGSPVGRFCARISDKFACSGAYDATSTASILSSDFTCSGGLTGTSITERRADAALGGVIGVRGDARLSDGSTARFVFPERPQPLVGAPPCD
jgi:hypothetical protein